MSCGVVLWLLTWYCYQTIKDKNTSLKSALESYAKVQICCGAGLNTLQLYGTSNVVCEYVSEEIVSSVFYAKTMPTVHSRCLLTTSYFSYRTWSDNYIITARCTIVQSAVLTMNVVCPSVTLVVQDHIGWKSWKLIAWTIGPTPSLDPPTPRGTYGNFGETIEVGWGKVACWSIKAALSLKHVNIEEKLLWRAYRNALSNDTIPDPILPPLLQDWGFSTPTHNCNRNYLRNG